MGKVRRVDYSPDEYIAGVGGVLRADEQGVYWMICSLIMSSAGPIEFNERRLASLCLGRPAAIRKIVCRLIAMGKISQVDGGKLSQKRAQSEVELSQKRIQIASENGAKGGRPAQKDKENQPNDKAAGLSAAKLSLTINHQPPIEEASISTKPAKRRISYSAKFEEFWKAYPTDPLMSKKQAGEAFARLSPEQQDEVLSSVPSFRAHCSAHVDYRPVHAVRYITQGRFEGFIASAAKHASRSFVEAGSPTWSAILRLRGISSMAHSDHDGKRGWWFPNAEIERATSDA